MYDFYPLSKYDSFSIRIKKKFLEEHNIRTWVCVEMGGGINYREEIVYAVKCCEVFIPLINDEWASSGECQDEYSLAKRLNLTSHEKGITKSSQPRKPIILPIAFPNLICDKYSHVELLAASTNFLIHNKPTLLEGDTTNLFQQVLRAVFPALISLGIKVQLYQEEMKTLGIGLIDEKQTTKDLSNKNEQLSYLDEKLEKLSVLLAECSRVQSEISSFKQLYMVKSKTNPQVHSEVPTADIGKAMNLKERYLGIWSQCVDGAYWEYSLEIKLTKQEKSTQVVNDIHIESYQVSGSILWKLLRLEFNDETVEGNLDFYIDYRLRIGQEATEFVEGNYFINQGLISIQGIGKGEENPSLIGLDKYRLILGNGGNSLEGLTQGSAEWESCFRAKAF